MSAYDTAAAYFCTVEDSSTNAYQVVVPDTASMYDRSVADYIFLADRYRHARIGMKYHTVLYVGPVAYDYFVGIRAQYRSVPDRAIVTQSDVTYQRGIRCYEYVFADLDLRFKFFYIFTHYMRI
jgi:hypothetical protein